MAWVWQQIRDESLRFVLESKVKKYICCWGRKNISLNLFQHLNKINKVNEELSGRILHGLKTKLKSRILYPTF